MRIGASRGDVTSSVISRVSPSDTPITNAGSGVQWWIQRPSLHLNTPFGARGSMTQLWKLGASACSAFCQPPTVVASTPWSNDVSTCWPRPVCSRTRSAALVASVAR